MNRQTMNRWLPLVFIAGYALFYFVGLDQVPFHPDEATQIYMSSDVDRFLASPPRYLYEIHQNNDGRSRYRFLDAPLARTSIGWIRWIQGKPALPADWSWSLSWQQNEANGALPSLNLLHTARLACAWMVPLSLLAFYDLCRKFTRPILAFILTLLLGLNPLVLLHTRRAMAEGWLFSLTVLLLWGLFTRTGKQREWIVLIVGSLLLQAKQTSAPLVGTAVVLLVLFHWRQSGWKAGLKTAFEFLLCALILFWGFNPVVWAHPSETIPQMTSERLTFSQIQAEEFAARSGGQALTNPELRWLGIIAQVFFAPPAYYDTGNYTAELMPAIRTYRAFPLNTSLSGWIVGSLLLISNIAAMVFSILRLRRKKMISLELPLWVFTLILTGFFTLFINIGFQRYYLIFLPLVYLWPIILCEPLHIRRQTGQPVLGAE